MFSLSVYRYLNAAVLLVTAVNVKSQHWTPTTMYAGLLSERNV